MTYGDGMTQHSGEWHVQVEFLGDYLASLATAMMSNEELLQHAHYDLCRRPTDKHIAFAASVVFKASLRLDGSDSGYEKKTRYYSMEQQVISSSLAKQHDKRFQQVEPWNDGSPDAIYRMLIPEYANGMEFYSCADAIRDWCQAGEENERPYFQGLTASFLKWFDGKTEPARELRYAYNAVKAICGSYRLRCEAETCLSNLHWPKAAAESVESEVA